MKEQMLTQ